MIYIYLMIACNVSLIFFAMLWMLDFYSFFCMNLAPQLNKKVCFNESQLIYTFVLLFFCWSIDQSCCQTFCLKLRRGKNVSSIHVLSLCSLQLLFNIREKILGVFVNKF